MQWDDLFAARAVHMQPSNLAAIFRSHSDPDVVSFAGGVPAPEHFPIERLRVASDTVLAERGTDALQYGPTQGILELRELIAKRLSTPNLSVRPENVIVVSGSQQGVDLVGRAFLDEGDAVLVENPTYIGMLSSWRIYNLTHAAMPVGAAGMSLADLDTLVSENNPTLIYLGSDFQNPTGKTFPEDQRRKLVQVLTKYRVPLVNDNPYVELRYEGEPVPSFLELAAQNSGVDGCAIHVGTFSKVLSPGMRMGYIVAPEAVIQRLAQFKQRMDMMTSHLDQFIAYEVARDGFLEAHTTHLRAVYRERRDAMLSAMDRYFPEEVTWTRPEGGMFIMVTMPTRLNGASLLAEAVNRKVTFIPGEPFHVHGAGKNTFRLSFSRSDPARTDIGIQRLGELLKDVLLERV